MDPLYTDPLYDNWAIAGDNIYNQSRGVAGAPSVFARTVGWVSPIYHSVPIPARQALPIFNYDPGGYKAPPVQHSESVGSPAPSAPPRARQSDIPFVQLKAPRFAIG
jgi:hypothetical protein